MDIFLFSFYFSKKKVSFRDYDRLLTEELADTLRISEAGTDLRIDSADAASLGHDGEQYFLVIVDKGTEHVVTYNTKTRSDPVDLLADYITITKRVPKFLRVDGAKEFVGAKMKALCHLHHITLQIVTSYSHTMQARVEGAIGIINSILALLFRLPMSQHVFGRMLPRISFTNVIFCGARLTEMDYYLPLKLAYSLFLLVLCPQLLTHLALVLSPNSQNFTAKLLAKVLAIAMLRASIYVPMTKRQLFICTT